ncbi:MAG: aldo/keto reductase [Alphaproteobacteria bacterium]|nr:aldo/keto reductase [Alphaproteobacteria bacterium]
MAIEKRPFGRTGHLSSAVIFGAAALGKVDQATADRTLDLLLEFGVNHLDTAPGYGDAELRMGPWMDRHRDDFFLATKTRDRTYAEARDSIQRSLERLRTDKIDLLQLHALIHPDEWDVAMSEDGALRAAVEARDAGLVRFIGVTGHGWNVAAMHRRSLAHFDFDSILIPYNWVTAHHATYADDFEETLKICQDKNVAVQTIKALARGPWAAGVSKRRSTWYEPLEAEEDIRTAVHYVLSRPGVFLNSVGDVGLLPSVLRAAAKRISLPDDALMAAHSERTGLSSIFGI